MPLVAMVCPQCGANLEFDENQKKRFCSFCGTEVVNEQINQTINNTNNYTTNVVKIVNGNLQSDADDYISSAEKYLSVQDYENAFTQSKLAIDKDPYDVRGYNIGYQCIKATLPKQIDRENDPVQANKLLEPLKRIAKSLSLIKSSEAQTLSVEVNDYLADAVEFIVYKKNTVINEAQNTEDARIISNHRFSLMEEKKKYAGGIVGASILALIAIVSPILAAVLNSNFLYLLTICFAISSIGLGFGQAYPVGKVVNAAKREVNACKRNIERRNAEQRAAFERLQKNKLYKKVNNL